MSSFYFSSIADKIEAVVVAAESGHWDDFDDMLHGSVGVPPFYYDVSSSISLSPDTPVTVNTGSYLAIGASSGEKMLYDVNNMDELLGNTNIPVGDIPSVLGNGFPTSSLPDSVYEKGYVRDISSFVDSLVVGVPIVHNVS